MRLACIQLNPQNNVAKNVERAENLIIEAAKNKAKVIVLPEMFSFMGADAERASNANEAGTGVFSTIQRLAQKLQVYIIGGSHAETSPHTSRVFNTSESYSPTGEMINRYRKIHLFNLFAENGEKLFCESDAFEAGNECKSFYIKSNNEQWTALTAICYDLRFPEIFRQKLQKTEPLDIIFLPAAFTHQTGKDHWEVLVRARAIENQCYVVACNQTGTFLNGTKRNYGHSIIVSPWGEIISQFNDEIGILYAEVSKQEISAARKKLPAVWNRTL